MAREEVDRLVADISRAIQCSDLLSVLHQNNRKICLSEIPKSILDERVMPIRHALENINAQELLGLEILRNNAGPRVREGVHCRPICDQIKQKWYVNDDDNDAAMDDDDRNSIVRYLHIAEVPDEYTIGIFVFGPHERIPLHDHPEMCVLSRVLYGDLQRSSLDLDRKGRRPSSDHFSLNNMIMEDNDEDGEENENNNNSHQQQQEDPNEQSFSSIPSIRNFLGNQSNNQNGENGHTNGHTNGHNSSSSFLAAAFSRSANWLHQNLYNGSSSSGMVLDDSCDNIEDNYPQGTKTAYRNAVDHLEAPAVASLYPYEGNLHEFVAGPYGAAVLDVLLPPYDDERRRDCTFYTIREMPPKQQPKRKLLRGGLSPRLRQSQKQQQKQEVQHLREPCLIIPTGQPENFHCISGRYRDLGELDDYQYDEDD